MKVGLVLGGGGLAGAAFHAGVLTALETDYGFDARASEVIVGTSAGALVGLMISLGVRASDVAAFMSGVPHHAEHEIVRNGDMRLPRIEPRTWSRLLRQGLPTREIAEATRRHPRHWLRPANIARLLPPGDLDVRGGLTFLEQVLYQQWPPLDLRVCAVRASSLELVVWDREGDVAVTDAVASSCSLPGVSREVLIDGEAYLDGGLRSPTNADVLLDADVDLALVLSPMTPAAPRGLHPVSRWAGIRLRHEVATLRRQGIEVIVLRAPREVAAAASSFNQTHNRRWCKMVGSCYLGARAGADRPDRLVLLTSNGQRRRTRM